MGDFLIERVPSGYAVVHEDYEGRFTTTADLVGARHAQSCLDSAYLLGVEHGEKLCRAAADAEIRALTAEIREMRKQLEAIGGVL